MFRVGQKVVCVHHHPIERRHAWARYPEKDAIYTIRGISPYKSKHLLLLHEISNGIHECGIEYGFNAIHFRPIVSRPTSIAVFEEILRTASTRLPSDMATAELRSADGGVR
jgi:hypothetical protein